MLINSMNAPVLSREKICAKEQKVFIGLSRVLAKYQSADVKDATDDAVEVLKSPNEGYCSKPISGSNCILKGGLCRVAEQNIRLWAYVKAAYTAANAKLEKSEKSEK